jgi:HlyD family secretion protein
VKKLFVVLCLVGVGLAIAAWKISHPGPSAAGEDAYTFETVQFGTARDLVSANARHAPQETLVVSSQVAGRVVEVTKAINEEVYSGDVLIKLDDREAREKLKEAEGACKQAESALEATKQGVKQAESLRQAARTKRDDVRQLLKLEQARQLDVDAAESQLEAAEAAVKSVQAKVGAAEGALEQAQAARDKAKLGLELTEIKVPWLTRESKPGVGQLANQAQESGAKRKYTVLDRQVNLNQMVGPALLTPLFVLAGDLSEMDVMVAIAEADISRVEIGQEAQFTVPAYDDARFPAKVTDIRQKPTSDQGVVFYQVVLQVKNVFDKSSNTWKLRPGMTASVDIVRRTHKDVWKVPTTAVNFALDEPYQTKEAKERVEKWYQTHSTDDWRTVWVIKDRKPWPAFIRVGGKNAQGDTAIHDAQHYEVLEWDQDMQASVNPKDPATYPKLIVGAPPVNGGGLFKIPNIKL